MKKEFFLIVVALVFGFAVGWGLQDFLKKERSSSFDPRSLEKWEISDEEKVKGFTNEKYRYSIVLLPGYGVNSLELGVVPEKSTTVSVTAIHAEDPITNNYALIIDNMSETFLKEESQGKEKTLEDFDAWVMALPFKNISDEGRDKIHLTDGRKIEFNGVEAYEHEYVDEYFENHVQKRTWINFVYNNEFYHLEFQKDNEGAYTMAHSLFFHDL